MFDIAEIIISTMVAIIALTFHEFAHGFIAYKMGDKTAYNFGRLSLNPLVHLDPFGLICMIFFRFGWAKPVPINPRNFKKPKVGFALSALAGPAMNIILGFFSCSLYILFANLYAPFILSTETSFASQLLFYTAKFFGYFYMINIGLGIFNLIPIPPFDGSRILYVLLPTNLYFKVMKYEKQIYWFVVCWLLLGTFVYKGLVSIPFVAANPVLVNIFKIFSLSSLISEATAALSGLIMDFWLLLPIF